MTDKTTEQGFKSREVLRKGFLAYMGLYGTAYDSARKFVNGKGADLFNDFIKKGEEVEGRVEERYTELRQRTQEKYAEQVESIEKFFSRASKSEATEVEDSAPSRSSKRVASKAA